MRQRQVYFARSGEGGEDAPALSADTQSQPGRSEAPRQIEAGLVAKVEDQSTAARKDVPGSLPVIENGPVLSDNGGRYPVNGEAKVLAASSEVPGTPAGTQAPPVDTPIRQDEPVDAVVDGTQPVSDRRDSEPGNGHVGETPASAGAPAAGEAVHTRTSPAVQQQREAAQ